MKAAAREIPMLELELELAYRDSERRVLVETPSGTFYARMINAGAFMVLAIPFDEPGVADVVDGSLPKPRSMRVLERQVGLA